MRPSFPLRTGAAARGVVLAAAFAVAAGCAAPPADDSRDYRARPSHDVTTEFTPEDVAAEIELGREVAARLLSRYGLFGDRALQEYVALVGRSVAMHAGRGELDYHFAVLDDASVNAFATPGGYIFITRGALDLIEDEAELAAVLAHEVAHVTERHIVHELGVRADEGGAVSGMARVIGSAGDSIQAAFATAIDQAVALLLEDGLEEQDELEADEIGTLLLAATGYDPGALRRYLARVAEQREAAEVQEGLAGTHPPFDVRLQTLDRVLENAGLHEVELPRMEERFHARIVSG